MGVFFLLFFVYFVIILDDYGEFEKLENRIEWPKEKMANLFGEKGLKPNPNVF